MNTASEALPSGCRDEAHVGDSRKARRRCYLGDDQGDGIAVECPDVDGFKRRVEVVVSEPASEQRLRIVAQIPIGISLGDLLKQPRGLWKRCLRGCELIESPYFGPDFRKKRSSIDAGFQDRHSAKIGRNWAKIDFFTTSQ